MKYNVWKSVNKNWRNWIENFGKKLTKTWNDLVVGSNDKYDNCLQIVAQLKSNKLEKVTREIFTYKQVQLILVEVK